MQNVSDPEPYVGLAWLVVVIGPLAAELNGRRSRVPAGWGNSSGVGWGWQTTPPHRPPIAQTWDIRQPGGLRFG